MKIDHCAVLSLQGQKHTVVITLQCLKEYVYIIKLRIEKRRQPNQKAEINPMPSIVIKFETII